jgi:hypothetical protein
MTTKTENYTAEMTTELVEAYTKAETSEARSAIVTFYAEKFGKTVNSVRAKLTREKVYVAKAYTNKKGEKPVKKDAIVTAIAGKIGMTVEACDSLEKVNKNVLEAIVKALG